MTHSCTENFLHVIFATKNRTVLIPHEIENRLFPYIAAIAIRKKIPVLRINGADDHIHMLINLHPNVALATLVKELKSYSTAWVKKNGFTEFSWQEGYGAFSASKSHVPAIERYIDNQKEHHKKQTFDQEIDVLNAQWGTSWKR